MMRVAPEGWPFIIGAWLVVAGLAALRFWIPLALWLPVAVWVVAFFRDPVREGERGASVAIAPADGKVVDVREVDEPSFVGGKALRICIFMNVFDVHVNRYPLDGTVAFRHYNPGKFLHAAHEKASLDNEQSSVGLQTSRGKVLVRQIAGLIARRIVTDHGLGTSVRQGERLGLIRFGSRVDLFLPTDAVPAVKVGDRTTAGQTVVARWN
ncbi:MAG TPA: phosphatidylserine decarboxylase family protein [Gemmatimonadales bacterium]|nr:phosphatidylserine decarboxylase family protein [Gemmatimonadales bacterium]